MSAYLIIGLPGHGKSYITEEKTFGILRRNHRWFKRYGFKRFVATNIQPDPGWIKNNPILSSYYHNFGTVSNPRLYWEHISEIAELEDTDFIIDEISQYADSRDFANLSSIVKRMLTQSDKVGVDIWANTQSPKQVDIMYKRNCERMFRVTKWFGSRRPSPKKPPIKFTWGLLTLAELERQAFDKEESEEIYKTRFWQIPHFIFIKKHITKMFDTRQKIVGSPMPLEHSERYCSVCGKKHIGHH